MTEWEQVKVSDLEEGDTVRFAGLEWQLVEREDGHHARFRRRNDTDFGFLLTRLPAAAVVERKVEPKTKQFLVTLTESPEEPGVHHVSQRFVGSPIAGMTTTAPWTLTKVEEQT